MKNLMFIIKFTIVVIIIGWIAKAWALKAAKVPEALLDESIGAVTVHQGVCRIASGEEALCVVGYKKETDTLWVLLYNKEGVLYKVLTVHNQVETTKWVHPMLSV